VSSRINRPDRDKDVISHLQRGSGGWQQVRRHGTGVYQGVLTDTDVNKCTEVRHVCNAARQLLAHTSVRQRLNAAAEQRTSIIYTATNSTLTDWQFSKLHAQYITRPTQENFSFTKITDTY